MELKSIYALILVFGTILILEVNGQVVPVVTKVGHKIYENINGSVTCFRRANGTHQIGCSSSFSGDVGVIHLVDSEDSMTWVTDKGPHAPYVALLYPSYFNYEILTRFRNSKRIKGVLLLRQNATKSFSTELTCPNRGYGFIRDPKDKNICPSWNSVGNGVLFQDWNFPIFFVPFSYNIEELLKCYEEFNKPLNGQARDWPLCAAQLHSFMHSAVDTPTCLRRSDYVSINPSRVCDPLGDYNIWSTLHRRNNSNPYPSKPEGSVMIIAARIDSSSMFDKIASGADSTVTGLVTLISIAKHLKTLAEKSTQLENVYFILFNGEAFDYIGSSRIVYDMTNDKFPAQIKDNSTVYPALLQMKNIKYFIEIGQTASQDGNYFAYFNSQAPFSTMNPLRNALKNNMDSSLKLNNLDDSTQGFPPASLQSFLRNQSKLAGVVITNHNEKFKNLFYNSVFDDAESIGYEYGRNDSSSVQDRIATLAASISSAVSEILDPSGKKIFLKDVTFVDELLNCYLKTWKCKYFRTVMDADVNDIVEAGPLSLYVGVNRARNDITTLTWKIMTYFLGEIVPKEEDECTHDPKQLSLNYYFMNGSCFESTVSLSDALSPAFVIENYDMKSGVYSTWTESVWAKISVRIFLKPSLTHELLTLFGGVVVFLLSLVGFGWVNRKSDIIFQQREGLGVF